MRWTNDGRLPRPAPQSAAAGSRGAQNAMDKATLCKATTPAMSGRSLILVLLIISFGAEPASAQGRLVGQEVRGARRSCIYENSGPDRARHPFRQTGVGAGEPCPFRYRPPAQSQAPSIPPMATLSTNSPGATSTISTPGNRRRSCRYSYLGVEYVRTIDQTLQCPMTPHFLPR